MPLYITIHGYIYVHVHTVHLCIGLHIFTHGLIYTACLHTCIYTYIHTQRKKDFLTLGSVCKIRDVLLLFAGKFSEETVVDLSFFVFGLIGNLSNFCFRFL